MKKGNVNGSESQPVFRFLRHSVPSAQDRSFDDEEDGPIGARKGDEALCHITWSPITRSDIDWNFEKFLISKDGVPVKRFSPKFETIKLGSHVEELIKQ